MILNRIIAGLVAFALLLAGVQYVRYLHGAVATQKALAKAANDRAKALDTALATAATQARETQAALLKRFENEARYEQDRKALTVARDAAVARSLRIPRIAAGAAPAQGSDTAPGRADATESGGLSAQELGAVEALLTGIWRGTAALSAEADQCAADLTALQKYTSDLLGMNSGMNQGKAGGAQGQPPTE